MEIPLFVIIIKLWDQLNLPNSIFFFIARSPLCKMESNIPATVKIPPIIAHIFVAKWPYELKKIWAISVNGQIHGKVQVFR